MRYIPEKHEKPQVLNASLLVKFSNRTVITNEHFLLGGSKWGRFCYRLKYMKMIEVRWQFRRLRLLVRRLFYGPPKIRPCLPPDKK